MNNKYLIGLTEIGLCYIKLLENYHGCEISNFNPALEGEFWAAAESKNIYAIRRVIKDLTAAIDRFVFDEL